MQRIKTLVENFMSDIGYYSVLYMSAILILTLIGGFLLSLISG
jgi:hypothetical protein